MQIKLKMHNFIYLKATAVILAFFITRLSVQTFISEFLYSFSTCRKECCEKQTDSDNDKKNSNCNPFSPCSICFGTTLSHPALPFSYYVLTKNVKYPMNNKYTRGYIAVIFKPPEKYLS